MGIHGNKVGLTPVLAGTTENCVSRPSQLESEVLPHLDAAYNLARWLARDPHDAEDVVQDACVRALRYVDSLRTGNGKAWFLTIVRNAFYDWVGRNRPMEIVRDATDLLDAAVDPDAIDPLAGAMRKADAHALADALAALPLQFREVLILRELEDLSYREIASVVGVPVGTVMSRLARGRAMLRRSPSVQALAGVSTERKQS
jgi:RNA polymerase sigma factor (sigma-70 family)